jgi:hypothetical protein
MLRWFAKENRRATPRHPFDGTDTCIQIEGSLTRPCQVLDLSRTGVRIAVANAQSLPNTFILVLSKHSAGRPVRVKWRSGTEVGAEFFKADSSSVTCSTAEAPRANSYSTSRLTLDAPSTNSSSASHLTGDAPKAVKPRGSESEKSENLMSTVPLHTRTQQPDAAKLKVDTRKVADSIIGDKAKIEADHRITGIGGQVDRSDQEKNSRERLDLSRLQKKLGPKHVALIHAVKDLDPESPHGQELAAIIKSLDETSDRKRTAPANSQSSPQSPCQVSSAGQRPINP